MEITKKIKVIKKKDKIITVYQNAFLYYVIIKHKNGTIETSLKNKNDYETFLESIN